MDSHNHFYSHFFRFEFWLSFALTFALFSMAQAADVPQSFTLDGRLYRDTGSSVPLVDNNVAFTVQIMDQAKTCVIYEESQILSTIATNGYFSVQVGSNVGSSRRTANDVGNSMASIFQNTAAIPGKISGSLCTAVAVSGSRRYIRVSVTPSVLGGSARVLSPDLALDSVPSAVIAERAESLEGLRGSDFLKVNNSAGTALTQANLESVFASSTRFNALTSLINGTSTSYMPSNTSAGAQLPVVSGAPASPNPGSMWLDSADGLLKYLNASGTPVTLGPSSGGTVTSVALTAPAEFSVTGAPITTSGTLGFAWTNQTPGKVFAAPSESAGTPTFRALAAGDIPALPWSKITSGLPTTLAGYGISAGIGDLKTSAGTQQFSGSASCTAKQTLTWSSLTDTFTCTNITGLDATTITSGTINAARIPASVGPWTVAGSDLYYTAGKVGIGNTSPGNKLTVYESRPETAFSYLTASSSTQGGNATAASSAWLTSFWGTATTTSGNSNANNGLFVGVRGEVNHPASGLLNAAEGVRGVVSPSSTGNITTATGVHGLVLPSGGTQTISSARGIHGRISNSNTTSTVTDAAAGYFDMTTNSGTITTGYGVYIANILGTTKYGLYQSDNTAKNHFAGNVGIGTTSPAAKLDVAGEVKFGNTSSTCNTTNEGQQRYNSIGKTMEFCNGTAWTAYSSAGATASTIPTVVVITSTSTWTCPAGVTRAKVTVVGGGGSAGSSISQSGVGGGGGGTAIKYLTVTPGTVYTATVGTGGPGNTASGSGSAGGTSSFAGSGITTISATGGSGGGTCCSGVAGGVGSNGDLNIPGGAGVGSATNSNSPPATGGSSFLAGTTPAGTAGVGYGSGAGGSWNSPISQSGGNGVVIIEY